MPDSAAPQPPRVYPLTPLMEQAILSVAILHDKGSISDEEGDDDVWSVTYHVRKVVTFNVSDHHGKWISCERCQRS